MQHSPEVKKQDSSHTINEENSVDKKQHAFSWLFSLQDTKLFGIESSKTFIILIFVFLFISQRISTHSVDHPVHQMTKVCLATTRTINSTMVYVHDYYLNALVSVGVVPVTLPAVSNFSADMILSQLDGCEGLIMVGGLDVDPSLYGEGPDPLLQYHEKSLDLYQLSLIKEAHALGIPIFGICRGMQILNVAFGGTLYQDNSYSPLPPNVTQRCTHVNTLYNYSGYEHSHLINIVNGTFLSELFPSLVTTVNSFHHQSVKKVAEGFKIAAFAPDGIIEAIESISGSWVGAVQFHPEMMHHANPIHSVYFKYFISQIKKR